MKPKVLPLLEQCIETGALLGYNRAHKHVEKPSAASTVDYITTAIMDEIYSHFDFEQS